MPAGTATLEVGSGELVHGRPTLSFRSNAESNDVIDKVFKVRDFNASTVDRASLASISFHQNLHEGGYRIIRTTTIDYSTGAFTTVKLRKGNTSEHKGVVSQPVQDILSAFFYMRTLALVPGKNESITVFSDGDTYQLLVKVAAKTERVSVAAGKFDCLRLDPVIKDDTGVFKSKDGQMTIWVTNDARKMPVLIRSRVAIGAFDAELKNTAGVSTEKP